METVRVYRNGKPMLQTFNTVDEAEARVRADKWKDGEVIKIMKGNAVVKTLRANVNGKAHVPQRKPRKAR